MQTESVQADTPTPVSTVRCDRPLRARWRRALRLVVCTGLAAWCGLVWSQTYEFDDVERVVAVGDIHGAYDAFHALLAGIGLIDREDQWRAGQTHLVSLGDLLDRGPDSRKVMDLLIRLQPQAAAAGGRVHVLLGNHELMNLTRDTRDVSAAEWIAFGGAEGHAEAFSMDGYYGHWLRDLPFAIRIDDSLFMHGGLSSLFDNLGDVNRRMQHNLATVMALGSSLVADGSIAAQAPWLQVDDATDATLPAAFVTAALDPLFAENGPLWYRGNAGCHRLIEESRVTGYLARLGVARVVVGHTPTPAGEIVERFDGRVYVIDTGMLASVYHGNARALEITDAATTVLTPDAVGALSSEETEREHEFRWLTRGAVVIADSGEAVLRLDDRERAALVTRPSRKDRDRAIAAYRLDRLLGLSMVPAVVERDIGGKPSLITLRERLITERERLERGIHRPAYCEVANDYDLVAAFDSLIGKTDRNVDNLAYDPRSWAIVLADNSGAFAPRAVLPTYRSPPTLSLGMARRLEALTEDALAASLGDRLKRREIKALLERKDSVLQWRTR